jgi:hypothetical protein
MQMISLVYISLTRVFTYVIVLLGGHHYLFHAHTDFFHVPYLKLESKVAPVTKNHNMMVNSGHKGKAPCILTSGQDAPTGN